jgi:hypothetical protein
MTTITTHEVAYHLEVPYMLKYLETKLPTYKLATKLGISKSAIYYYKTDMRKVKDKTIYKAVLTLYYYYRIKQRTYRLFKVAKVKNVA